MSGYPVTATITTTAGAHSIQPSLRSARAPSDSCGLAFFASCSTVVPTATCADVLIGPLLSSRPDSRNQSLRLQRVVDLADHRLLGAGRADALRRREQVRDVDGHDLVHRRLRP